MYFTTKPNVHLRYLVPPPSFKATQTLLTVIDANKIIRIYFT